MVNATAPADLPAGRIPVPNVQDAGGKGGGQDRSGRVHKISPSPAFEPRTVQLVASRYTDWVMESVKKQSVLSQSEELSRYLDGNTVENHENCRSGSNRAPPKYMSETAGQVQTGHHLNTCQKAWFQASPAV
jgi:hypothetical protein